MFGTKVGMVLKWSVGYRLKNFLIIKEKGVNLNGKVKGKRFYYRFR